MNRNVFKHVATSGVALLLIGLIGAPPQVAGQQYFGTILGTVTDPSSAAVPECSVSATNVSTGIARTATTDNLGNYSIGSLVPGRYSLRAERTGFQTSEVASVDLSVAGALTVNFTLKIGEVTQTVEVQAVAPLLDTTSATVGTTVSNASVLEMPLNGRTYTDLLLLIPGSVKNGTIYQASGGGNYSISGNRFEQNQYTLDGVSNNEGFFKSYGIQPAIDAIQEFKVQTNITSAEFGEAAGANVAVATKSGTNHLHGSA